MASLVLFAMNAWLAATYELDAWTVTGIATSVLVIVGALSLRALRAWGRRVAGRMLTRRAAKMFDGFRRAAPASISYVLDASGIEVHSARVPTRGRLDLAWARRVYHCGDVIYTVPTPGRLPRILFAPASELRELLAAFAGARAEIFEVTAPIEGYGDPLPAARALG